MEFSFQEYLKWPVNYLFKRNGDMKTIISIKNFKGQCSMLNGPTFAQFDGYHDLALSIGKVLLDTTSLRTTAIGSEHANRGQL